jgi:hypothetical protein
MMSRREELRDGMIPAPAQRTPSSIEVVAHLYDAELAYLEANSHVKKFIEVIAGRRLKKRLLHMHG